MSKQTIKVPDIGTDQAAEVAEVLVSEGDSIEVEQSIIVLETEKASVEVPSTHAGKVVSVLVKEGDELKTGAAVLEIETEAAAAEQKGGGEEEPSAQGKEPSAQGKEPSAQGKEPSAADTERAAKAEAEPAKQGGAGKEIDVSVPDIGDAGDVEVIELSVSIGDEVEEGDSLLVLESDKASMEIPSPSSGKVVRFLVGEGDKVKQGQQIAVLQAAGGEAEPAEAPAKQEQKEAPEEPAAQPAGAPEAAREMEVSVPDIGDAGDVEVIELSASVGDEVEEGDSLLVLESDKASMEIPSPSSGKVVKFLVGEGDRVKQGQQIAVLQTVGKAAPTAEAEPKGVPAREEPKQEPAKPAAQPARAREAPAQVGALPRGADEADSKIYAGPAVRKLARQLGVDLTKVKPSGPRNRYTKDDLRSYVKDIVTRGGTGTGIPAVPAIDFAKFGEIKRVKMSKIKRSTATNMHRSWLNVPHVTQFDEADISELETYRKGQKPEAEKRGTKLTPLPFLIKACALTLQAEPSFNVSLDPDGQHIIEKQYINIGMAVDSPGGLMVPVIRDVDQKDIWQLAEETIELATKAREGKLSPKDMQGGCFSISSLGAIGGQGFTPVVNTPEVGILGVSKAGLKPYWDGKSFVPHTFLPLSLSYDHRAVNGADAGRFLTHLVGLMSNYKEWIE